MLHSFSVSHVAGGLVGAPGRGQIFMAVLQMPSREVPGAGAVAGQVPPSAAARYDHSKTRRVDRDFIH